jgi:hypothetical protein
MRNDVASTTLGARMQPSPRRCRSRCLCALVLPFLLGSCMTMGLWGYERQETWNVSTQEYDGEYVAVAGTQWEWWRVLLRVLVTPVTLVLDGTGGLIEGVVSCWADDDDGGYHFRSRGANECGDSRGNPNMPKPPPPPVVERPGGGATGGKPMLSGVRR